MKKNTLVNSRRISAERASGTSLKELSDFFFLTEQNVVRKIKRTVFLIRIRKPYSKEYVIYLASIVKNSLDLIICEGRFSGKYEIGSGYIKGTSSDGYYLEIDKTDVSKFFELGAFEVEGNRLPNEIYYYNDGERPFLKEQSPFNINNTLKKLDSRFNMDSISNVQNEAIKKISQEINAKKEIVLKEKLKENGIEIKIEDQIGRRFPLLIREIKGSEEAFYYNDGSLNGLRIVTFIQVEEPIDLKERSASITCTFQYY